MKTSDALLLTKNCTTCRHSRTFGEDTVLKCLLFADVGSDMTVTYPTCTHCTSELGPCGPLLCKYTPTVEIRHAIYMMEHAQQGKQSYWKRLWAALLGRG